MKPIDMSVINKRFGNLTVVGFSHRNRSGTYFSCKCDCGKIKNINIDNVKED